MLLTSLKFLAVLVVPSLAANILEPKAICPLTEVTAYEYGCNHPGWVDNPSYLKILRKIDTILDCANECHSRSKCKSMRYVKESKSCFLYDKYLDSMEFDTSNFEQGYFYERECFTSDCNTIKACQAISTCNQTIVQPFQGGSYADTSNYFACGYGVYPHIPGAKEKEILYPGSMTACQVALNCTSESAYPDFYGIVYSIPKDMWICVTARHEYDTYSYYPTTENEYISDRTFLEKNSTIGAAYGYRLVQVYVQPP